LSYRKNGSEAGAPRGYQQEVTLPITAAYLMTMSFSSGGWLLPTFANAFSNFSLFPLDARCSRYSRVRSAAIFSDKSRCNTLIDGNTFLFWYLFYFFMKKIWQS